MMNHYRLQASEADLPAPAVVVPLADIEALGGPELLGMRHVLDLQKNRLAVPRADFDADLRDELAIGFYSRTIDGEAGFLVRYEFAEPHGAWGDEVHARRQLLVLATSKDLKEYATQSEAFADAWVGGVGFIVRMTTNGVGTRGPLH